MNRISITQRRLIEALATMQRSSAGGIASLEVMVQESRALLAEAPHLLAVLEALTELGIAVREDLTRSETADA